MIIGVGLDLAEIARIADMLERWGARFANKVFTPGELAFANGKAHPAQHLAARFAAKEATLKALGVPSGCTWHDMEVTGGGRRPPELVIRGRAAEAARALGVARLHLTITHADPVAAAVVIAEGTPAGPGVADEEE